MSILNDIANFQGLNPLGEFAAGREDKRLRERQQAQDDERKATGTLNRTIAQFNLDQAKNQADRDDLARLAASQQSAAIGQGAAGFLDTKDQAYIQELVKQGPEGLAAAQKVIALGDKLTPEAMAEIITPDLAQKMGFNPGAVVQRNPDGRTQVLQQGQAPLSAQQQQSADLAERKFAADQENVQADNDRADAQLALAQNQAANPDKAKLSTDTIKSRGFFTRMDNAANIMAKLENEAGFDPTNFSFRTSVGGVFGTQASENRKLYDNAANDWAMAVLRVESGGAINKDEIENTKRIYFPQPFDSQAVIDQKNKARGLQNESMRIRAQIEQQQELSQEDQDAGWVRD